MIDWTISHQKITPHTHNLIIIWLRLSYNDDDDLDCQPYIHRPPDLVITFSILSYDDDDLDGDDDVDYDDDMRMMMMIEEMIMTMTLMVVITSLIPTDHLTSLSYFQGFERQGLWREGMGGVYWEMKNIYYSLRCYKRGEEEHLLQGNRVSKWRDW